jgi:hypothetical protein
MALRNESTYFRDGQLERMSEYLHRMFEAMVLFTAQPEKGSAIICLLEKVFSTTTRGIPNSRLKHLAALEGKLYPWNASRSLMLFFVIDSRIRVVWLSNSLWN